MQHNTAWLSMAALFHSWINTYLLIIILISLQETSSTVQKFEGPLWKVLSFYLITRNLKYGKHFKTLCVCVLFYGPQSSRFLGWRYHWVVLEDGNLSWYHRQWVSPVLPTNHCYFLLTFFKNMSWKDDFYFCASLPDLMLRGGLGSRDPGPSHWPIAW